jgi:hypothetical protein
LKQITEPRAPQVRRIWTCEFTLGLEGLGEHRFTQFPSEVAVLGSTHRACGLTPPSKPLMCTIPVLNVAVSF